MSPIPSLWYRLRPLCWEHFALGPCRNWQRVGAVKPPTPHPAPSGSSGRAQNSMPPGSPPLVAILLGCRAPIITPEYGVRPYRHPTNRDRRRRREAGSGRHCQQGRTGALPERTRNASVTNAEGSGIWPDASCSGRHPRRMRPGEAATNARGRKASRAARSPRHPC